MNEHVSVKSLGVDWKEFDEKGRKRLAELEKSLLPEHKGRIIAIEPESGEYLIGGRQGELIAKALAKYPGKLFYFARIGIGPVVRFINRTEL